MSSFPDFFRPLVISGPSGVGKSTLLQRLFSEFPGKFGFSVSHTTRDPRPGEIDGSHYHFVTRQKFLDLVQSSAFIEHAQFSGNFYGTSFEAVERVQQQGKRCILDIEAQGVQQIKKTDLNPVYLFISPPTISILRERLRRRATDTEDSIQKRLMIALNEVQYAKQPNTHDIVIVNDDLDRAFELLKGVALGERIVGDTLPLLDN
jgi:guanylate kinase